MRFEYHDNLQWEIWIINLSYKKENLGKHNKQWHKLKRIWTTLKKNNNNQTHPNNRMIR